MKIIISTLLLLLGLGAMAQTVSQAALTSGSSSFSQTNLNYSYTIGGVFSGTISNGASFTQGFQQPELIGNKKNSSKNYFKVQLFPNPVIDNLNIRFYKLNESEIIVNVFDMSGKVVKTQSYVTSENEPSKMVRIDLSNLQSGNYIVSLSSKQNIPFVSFKTMKN